MTCAGNGRIVGTEQSVDSFILMDLQWVFLVMLKRHVDHHRQVAETHRHVKRSKRVDIIRIVHMETSVDLLTLMMSLPNPK
jgi:hypothetical protein